MLLDIYWNILTMHGPMNVKCILSTYFLIQYTIVCVHFNRQRKCDAAKGIIVGNIDIKIGRCSFNCNLLVLPTRYPRGKPSAKYWSNTLRAFNVRFDGCVW